MAKGKKAKKKNWKLRRQLRKTFGCLFMVSALIVTAIPVQPTEAGLGNPANSGWTVDYSDYKNHWVYSTTASMPNVLGMIPKNGQPPVYQDQSGRFRFVYVDSHGDWSQTSERRKSAVIVGYDGGALADSALTIPASMDAYIKYTDTATNGSPYAAANKQGKPLYYKTWNTTRSIQNEPVLTSEDLNGDNIINDYIYPETGEYAYSKTADFVEPAADESKSSRTASPNFKEFMPCTPDTESTWNGMDLFYFDNATGIPTATALKDDNDPGWKLAYGDDVGRIVEAPVEFIGNYYAEYNGTSYTIVESTSVKSVFGGAEQGVANTNIRSLKFAVDPSTKVSPLRGIGNFAFFGCTGITSVNFGNGLSSLGNFAFGNCRALKSATLVEQTDLGSTGSALDTLGAGAFIACESLQSFWVPYSIKNIGDFCFKDCSALTTVTLTDDPNGLGANLEQIGYRAFENCAMLQSLTFPTSYKGAEGDASNGGLGGKVFHLSTVAGCKQLKFIKTFDESIQFVTDAENEKNADGTDNVGGYNGGKGYVDGSNYTISMFKSDVDAGFYFEAPGYVSGTVDTKTPAHKMANANHICFKYLGDERYEVVEDGKDANSNAVGLVFQVDKDGSLIKFQVENTDGTISGYVHVPEINMPEKVGQIGIVRISEGSFDHNCYIEKVVIPGTVKEIGPNAFLGSHNLKHIIFSNAANIESIGSNAFATQVVDKQHGNPTVYPNTCKKTLDDGTPNPDFEAFLNPDQTPFLSFTGAIEKDDGTNTEPFKHAMREGAKINAGQQQTAYITYYSGLPMNLTVKYNPDVDGGIAELQHFPSMKDLEEGFAVTKDEYVGAYQPLGSSNVYRYPYMTDELAQRIKDAAAGSGSMSEEMTAMVNSVENVVIPTGVNAIKEGLFSGLDTEGKIVGGGEVPVLDADGNPVMEEKKDDQGNTVMGDDGNPVMVPVMEHSDEVYPEDDYEAPAKDIKTLTTKSIINMKPYTFARLPELEKAYVSGSSIIGDYAFDKCPKLDYAEVGPETSQLGVQPFARCDKLVDVKFNENPSFTQEGGIIFGTDANGTKTKIVECLAGRGSVGESSMTVGPEELAGIKEIAVEAFANCPSITRVDLSSTGVTEVPERCFADSKRLSNVILPGVIRAIRAGSFWNTDGLTEVTIPNSIGVIAPNAFAKVDKVNGKYDDKNPQDKDSKFQFITTMNPKSVAALYADDYSYIMAADSPNLRESYQLQLWYVLGTEDPVLYDDTKFITRGEKIELTVLDIPDMTEQGYEFSHWQPTPEQIGIVEGPLPPIYAYYVPIGANVYTVRFFDINKEEMEEYTQRVEEGKNAVPPTRDVMAVEGKVFTGWDRDYNNITNNMDIYAQYTDREAGKYYVTFYTDADLATMIGKVQEVDEGESAIEPAHPRKDGYTFAGWSSDGWQNVTRDWEIFAVYTPEEPDNPDNPDKPDDPKDPDKPDEPTTSGNSSGNNDNNNNNNNEEKKDDTVSENATKYKVVVNGGSGSGDYTAGTIVPINAYARADGTVFDKWTSSSNGVGFVNQTAISTTFTMPANDVEITANFKTGSSSSSVSGNSRSARRNSTTTVDVTKNGISNTGLASANVNGSSDNYVIRITDDAQATAAVIAALEAKYGDMSNIAYLPMDISLYDSTGQTKITDVSGITVDITLPLPDGLIQYAGNNRAAAVSDGRLEDLNTKFTTIDGVPCVQFTATHFSPYTIYVDKGNLSEGLMDATPKTGDPIHPKWFLAMGLACISIILFCKKDKRQPNVKAA